jgi:TPR repeat protein
MTHLMSKRSNIRVSLITGVLASLACASLFAEEAPYFPGSSTDKDTVKAQQLVEELYEAGDYRRSFTIYTKELAPIGDKYAQYMVGFMHLNGQGTENDRSVALAWYRLAAERRDPSISQARDMLYLNMSQEEVMESNEIFMDLWRKYGDNKIILALVKRDLEVLASRPDSRIGSSSTGPTTAISLQSGTYAGDSYYERIEKRIAMRVEFLDANVEIVDLELGEDLAVKQSLEVEFQKQLEMLDIS